MVSKKKNQIKKIIVCVDCMGNEHEFKDLKEAAQYISGGWVAPIRNCIKGKQPTAFGMRWYERRKDSN